MCATGTGCAFRFGACAATATAEHATTASVIVPTFFMRPPWWVSPVDHPVQTRDRLLDVEVLVLSCSAFRREECTAVDLLEIAVGELVMLLRVRGLRGVHAQVPPTVFTEAVALDERVLLLRGRTMLAPRVAVVPDHPSLGHQGSGMAVGLPIEFHANGQNSRTSFGKTCLTSSISPSVIRFASTVKTARATRSAPSASMPSSSPLSLAGLNSRAMRARNCSRWRSFTGLPVGSQLRSRSR